MGQAKARGSFEQRRIAAVERDNAERIALEAERESQRAAEREAEAALPEAVRERRRQTRHRRNMQTAMLAGLIVAFGARGQP